MGFEGGLIWVSQATRTWQKPTDMSAGPNEIGQAGNMSDKGNAPAEKVDKQGWLKEQEDNVC